jgi:hypothetical protein
VSGFSAINGEVVVTDLKEWLKGAGQMNLLEEVPPQKCGYARTNDTAKKNK